MTTVMSKDEVVYQDLDKQILGEYVKPRITKAIIEEHKRKPIGKHSDELERVLIYLRKHHGQMKGKYIIVCTKSHKEWRMGELSGIRGVPPKIYRNEKFNSREAAEHGIFLRRLKDLGLWK